MISLSIPSWCPDCAGNVLDGAIVELSENIEGHDHLGVIEGFSCPLAKQKDTLEHVDCVPKQIDLKDAVFMRVVLVFLVFVLALAIAFASVLVEATPHLC